MLRRTRRVSVVGGLLTAVLIQVGGPQPTDATTAPECQVWVSSLGSSTLTVIDTWTSAPSTIELNGNPSISDFTFNRTGTKIFVATMNGLRMIDPATYGVSTIASGIYGLGGDFGAIAASPTADRIIATTNQWVNGTYPYEILNSLTGALVSSSTLSQRSADVAFDPSGHAYAADFVFLAANPAGRLDKIDISVPTTLTFTDVNLAFSEFYTVAEVAAPAGQTPILFVGSNQNTLAADNYFLRAIDTTNMSILATATLQSSPSGMAVSAAGDRLFVSQFGTDEVLVLDTITRNVVSQISVGDGPSGLAVTPDGRFLYVANSINIPNQQFGTVSKIDLSTMSVVGTITVNSSPTKMAIGPTGCVSEQPQVAPTTTVPANSSLTTTVQSLPTTGPSSSNESFANISLIFLAVGVVVVFARRRRLVA
jgi:YVTN family beta-propeller protein